MKYKVLIVDDSAFMRSIISDLLVNHPQIGAIETAINGRDALRKINEFQPDVVTLDIEMPIMNGIDTLQEIMKVRKIPVIMCSTLTSDGAEITIKALELGAFDFIEKPQSVLGEEVEVLKQNLLNKILAAAQGKKFTPVERKIPEIKPVLPTVKESMTTNKLVVIGTSTGGPQALHQVIPYLPRDIPASILIVQHMPEKFTEMFAQRLDKASKITIREAKEGDMLEKGLALLAPGNFHMELRDKDTVTLNQKPQVCGVRPAVDITLASAAEIYRNNLICVILTGMGHDGTNGSSKVRNNGGYCIAEDESTCVVYGMPKNIVENGNANEVVPLHKVADSIVRAVYR